ncbi:MAG TPA: hypothetical protein VLB80_02220 [Candidatus Babeliales bacterium]|nr:hypothetical protein [Candidatus Babeliales bacterium]
MKKNYFISFFIAVHILFIFLQVHKHTLFIKNSYNHQQCEKQITLLTEKQQTLTQELYVLKDRESIKKYAQNKLKMHPYVLSQVKKL